MSTPVIEKNWQFNVNTSCGGKSNVTQSAADYTIKVKDALVGFPSGQWSVKASSDGITADLNDNWNDYTTLVWSTGNHAWIVLANSATGMEICFDFNTTSANSVEFVVSYGAGFDVSSPSLSARPTAADEVTWTTTDAYGMFNSAWVGRLHVMMTTDGLCTRFMQCFNNNLQGSLGTALRRRC